MTYIEKTMAGNTKVKSISAYLKYFRQNKNILKKRIIRGGGIIGNFYFNTVPCIFQTSISKHLLLLYSQKLAI